MNSREWSVRLKRVQPSLGEQLEQQLLTADKGNAGQLASTGLVGPARRRKSSPNWLCRANFGPILARLRQTLAKLGPNLAKIGQLWSNFGQMWPRFGRFGPTLGKFGPEPGQSSPKNLEQDSTELAQIWGLGSCERRIASWAAARGRHAGERMTASPERPFTAEIAKLPESYRQVARHVSRKVTPCDLGNSEVVQKLPKSCPTTVEQLPWERRIGPKSA